MQRSKIPENILSWLLMTTSTTVRLRAMAFDKFNVRILFQGWQLPLVGEAGFLEIPFNEPALIREVQLCIADKVQIFARSVFPKETVMKNGLLLSKLGRRPLGDVIWQDPTLTRTKLELAALRSKHQYFS